MLYLGWSEHVNHFKEPDMPPSLFVAGFVRCHGLSHTSSRHLSVIGVWLCSDYGLYLYTKFIINNYEVFSIT